MEEPKDLEVVNQKTGEILEPPTPENLLVAASEAAKALQRVIDLNERPPLMFNGKRYLEFHHWMTIGKFYNATVRTLEPQFIEIAGVPGFKARAEVLDEKTGSIIGGAEAFCMRDEPNWKTKPTFQLASMAQTRAASKALSNKFRFVAIVAGYEGTPSEEMTNETPQKQVAMPKRKEPSANEAAMEAQAPQKPLEAALRPPESKFFASLHKIVREKGVKADTVKEAIKSLFNKDSSKDLTDDETVTLIKQIERGVIK